MDTLFKILGIILIALLVEFGSMMFLAKFIEKKKNSIAFIASAHVALKALITILLTIALF